MNENKDLKKMNNSLNSHGLLSRALEMKNATIIENKDGIAFINQNIDIESQAIDPEFKRLVDSVLR